MKVEDLSNYLDQLHSVNNMIGQAKLSYLKAKVVDANAKDLFQIVGNLINSLKKTSTFMIQLVLYVMSLFLFSRED